MATLSQNAAEVASCATAIDAAIIAKGGTTAGGLRNAAAGIAALPSGVDNLNAVLSRSVDGLNIITTATSLNASIFNGCTGTFSFTGNNVTSVGSYCFGHCSLSNLTLPALKTVGVQTFFYAIMRNFDLSSLETVDSESFAWCTWPSATVTLPSLKTVGWHSFANFSGGLDELNLPSLTTFSNNYAFENNGAIKRLRCDALLTPPSVFLLGVSSLTDVYLASISYDPTSVPSGFPYSANTTEHQVTFHFSNCEVWYDGGAWVVKS